MNPSMGHCESATWLGCAFFLNKVFLNALWSWTTPLLSHMPPLHKSLTFSNLNYCPSEAKSLF